MTLVDLLVELDQTKEARKRLVAWMRKTQTLVSLNDLVESNIDGGDVRSDRNLDFLIDLMSTLFGVTRRYECPNCGFKGKSMHWQCPGCKNWNSTGPAKTILSSQER